MVIKKPIPLPTASDDLTGRETNLARAVKRSPKEPIITRQRYQLILNFIWEYRRVKGYSPKYEEIAVGIGYVQESAGTVYTHIQHLIAEGWLEQRQQGARMIFPTKSEHEVYADIVDPELKRIAKQQRNLRILRRM